MARGPVVIDSAIRLSKDDRRPSNRHSNVVALFLPALPYGGAERMTVNLADALVAAGVTVDLVLARAVGDLLSEVPREVRVIDLRARGLGQATFFLASYLRRGKPAGLIARMQHANTVAATAHWLARSTARLVLTEATHGTRHALEGSLAHRMRYRLLGPVTRRAYRRADAVVAVSQGVAADLARRIGVNTASLHVVPNPVVTDSLLRRRSEEPSHPWLREPRKQNLPSGRPPVILAVGSLREAKDFATLLRAFAVLRRSIAARLIIFGEGPKRRDLEQLRAALGLEECVQMPGIEPNPYSAMARASLLVLSSRREGSPNVLVEALACGCPVVATDCPSGPAEILEGGRFGLLAPVGNPEALAAAMRRSLRSTWDREALCAVSCRYDSHQAAQRYLDLLGIQPNKTYDGLAALRAAA